MRAVVLVGGFGTRLRPLTLTVPKQLLPICGVTMLERVVAKLGDAGVGEVVLSLGYQPDQFISSFPEGRCGGVDLVYAQEPEPLDTAGAIAFAARAAGIDDTFIAVNGDVLTDLALADLMERHRAVGAEGTLHLTPVDDPSRYGVVPTTAEGRVLDFVEKPDPGTAPSHWVNAGTYVLEPGVLDRIPSGRRVSIEREVFPAMVADQSLYALPSSAYWIDAGTPEAYLQAQLDLLDGVRGKAVAGVHPTAVVDPTAKVDRAVIGPDTVIGPRAQVLEAVVMSGTAIAADARVERSIVGERSEIGEGAVLGGLTVIGFDQSVGAGETMDGGRVPSEGEDT